MDSVDTLFSQIQTLKNEEKELQEKLSKLKKDIDNKKLEKLNEYWSEGKNSNNENFFNTIKELKQKINDQIEIKSIEHTFQYIPLDLSYTNVFISGDFNNWDMTEMKKDYSSKENKYISKFTLKKGFEYAYCYFLNGERFIDFNQPFKNISYKDNGEYNYIDIEDEKGKFIQFEKINVKKGNDAKKNIESLINIKGNEDDFTNNVFQLNDLIYQKKIELMNKKNQFSTQIKSKYNSRQQESKEEINNLYNNFITNFKNRIIVYENVNYIIIDLNMFDRQLRVLRLYDPNGIKIDIKQQMKFRFYKKISLNTLFKSSYILSKLESDIIRKDHEDDKTNYIKIFYQLQQDTKNELEKDLIPYRIEPSYVDINQYNLEIKDNLIRSVTHKQSQCFVFFDTKMIGDNQKSGLVSNDPIKVYTTLESKDILNILHIHINDISEEITIDSIFLEKNDNILNYKNFTTDVTGRRLNYKFIFQNYKLIKIFYCMSIDFIDEPLFQEIKFSKNGFIKIIKGEFKNYYGKIKEFPIGMLARKDNEETQLKKMKSFEEKKEGHCGDRHLDELPGFVSVEIMFYPGNEIKEMKDYIKRRLPICHLIPLNPKEEIKFEKSIVLQNNSQVMKFYNLALELEKYLNQPKLLEEFDLEKIKEILQNAESINDEIFKNLEEDLEEKIKFAVEIKGKIIPLLQNRIRLLFFSSKK